MQIFSQKCSIFNSAFLPTYPCYASANLEVLTGVVKDTLRE